MHMNIGRVRKGELDPKNTYRPLQMSNLDINKMGLTQNRMAHNMCQRKLPVLLHTMHEYFTHT